MSIRDLSKPLLGSPEKLECARAYLEAGIPVIPLCTPLGRGRCLQHGMCSSPGFKPVIQNWKQYEEEMPTSGDINFWWSFAYPEANIGTILGGVSGMCAIVCDRMSVPGGMPKDGPALNVSEDRVAFLFKYPTTGMPRRGRFDIPGPVQVFGEKRLLLLPPSLTPTTRILHYYGGRVAGVPDSYEFQLYVKRIPLLLEELPRWALREEEKPLMEREEIDRTRERLKGVIENLSDRERRVLAGIPQDEDMAVVAGAGVPNMNGDIPIPEVSTRAPEELESSPPKSRKISWED